eukprot:363628-Chlamydomonas_euryale.AAC.12
MCHVITGVDGSQTDPSEDGAPRSVAEDGRVEQLKNLRTGHRNIKDITGMYNSAIRGYHEEGHSGGTNFRDFLKLLGHTKLIPWSEI